MVDVVWVWVIMFGKDVTEIPILRFLKTLVSIAVNNRRYLGFSYHPSSGLKSSSLDDSRQKGRAGLRSALAQGLHLTLKARLKTIGAA